MMISKYSNVSALPVANRNVAQPMSTLVKRGLAGLHAYMRLGALGDDAMPEQLSGPGADAAVQAPSDSSSLLAPGSLATVGTAINSEIGWLTNLVRGAQGKPALPTSVTAPTVNVGLGASTQSLVTYGLIGAGAIAVIALMKKKRR